jgi:hypothetical protein
MPNAPKRDRLTLCRDGCDCLTLPELKTNSKAKKARARDSRRNVGGCAQGETPGGPRSCLLPALDERAAMISSLIRLHRRSARMPQKLASPDLRAQAERAAARSPRGNCNRRQRKPRPQGRTYKYSQECRIALPSRFPSTSGYEACMCTCAFARHLTRRATDTALAVLRVSAQSQTNSNTELLLRVGASGRIR